MVSRLFEVRNRNTYTQFMEKHCPFWVENWFANNNNNNCYYHPFSLKNEPYSSNYYYNIQSIIEILVIQTITHWVDLFFTWNDREILLLIQVYVCVRVV